MESKSKYLHFPNKNIQFILLLIILSLWGCGVDPAVSEMELHQNWSFKKSTETNWHKAEVPGTVHTDLLSLKKIEDPFYRLNEHNLQWIDKEDWVYQTNFELTKKDLSWQNIELEFYGIDTYSKIYLNDSLLLQTDNMFRNYSTEVKTMLKEGANELRIVLESPIRKGVEKYDALGYKIPVSDNDLSKIGQVTDEKKVSIFTRKAGYHFGWDWGPRLVTSGIWKPVQLKRWNHHKIEDVFIKQHKIKDTANLSALIEVTLDDKTNKEATVDVFVNQELIKTEKLQLSRGKNKLNIPFTINNPKLWWPNGMGDQVLYDVELKVQSDNHVDSKLHKIGLRTIELVKEPDTIGKSFYFKVNDHPVFMKGANYIPQDVFLTRVKKSNYKEILTAAKEANMNMLRVWGGGIYENEEFYRLCDEMGLLVWQDFMFACAMFPGDQSFLENVKQEAIDNVKRLRNHTSIALWCGNNEILSAWENWGWKDKVTQEQSKQVADTIWKAYEDIFHNILPEVVTTYDNTRAYWPSSPGSEFGVKESFEKGDAHYWQVWWGKKPFDNYNTAIPRFMSEYGFQSFPALATVEKYTVKEDHDVYSEVMKSHQRSSIGNETIEEYMLRHYRKPKDFSSFLYVSQLLQSHGIQIGIEAHRRNRDRCMGSLYWQINDCWPVASWSGIDYYGKWKALHYTAKKAFKNFLISYENKKDSINVFVVSDSLKDTNATLKLRLMDFEGNPKKELEKHITVIGNASEKHFTIGKDEFLNSKNNTNLLLEGKLLLEDKVIAENILYLSPFKELDLPKPELRYTITENENYLEIVLRSKRLAKNVFLSSLSKANFSDNYFDLLPNTEKKVILKKDNTEDIKAIQNSIKVFTLVDTYEL